MRLISHLRYPLDRVFSVSTRLPILRALQDNREGMSGRAIAREAGINHQSCAVAVNKLETLKLLQRQGSGKTQLIRLNFDNYIVKNLLLPLLRQEREFQKALKREIVEVFREDALSITLFGSAARAQDVPESDIDLLLLVQAHLKNKIQDKAITYCSVFMPRYGIRLSPIIMTVGQARDRVRREDPLMKNILYEGVDLLPKKLHNFIK